MLKEINLIEVETLQAVRLNGKDEPAGKLVKIPKSLLSIWLGRGLCKLSELKKPLVETPPIKDGDEIEVESNNSTSSGTNKPNGSKTVPKSGRKR